MPEVLTMTSNKLTHLQIARQNAKQGLKVFPVYGFASGHCVCPQGNQCKCPGKHPRTSHGVHDATTDAEKVRAWWKQWPHANIGIATGKDSGIFVLDIDKRSGGIELMKKLEEELGALPETVRAETGGGGYHLIFEYPDFKVKKDSAGKTFGKGIDVLGEGAYFVAPPSKHVSGERYRFKKGYGFSSRKICSLPDNWLKVLRNSNEKAPDNRTELSVQTPKHQAVFVEGERNSGLTSLGGGYRAQGFELDTILSKLMTDNLSRCNPPLNESEVESIAKSVSQYPIAGGGEVDVANELCSRVLAEHFANGKHLLHAQDGQFWAYTGSHWKPIENERLQQLTLETLNRFPMRRGMTMSALMSQVLTLLKARQHDGDDPLNLCQEPLQVFNCANGEVHVTADGLVQLKPHSSASYLRHCSSIVYDPNAKCPLYDQALNEIFSKAEDPSEMRRHWNELMGYMAFPSRKIAVIIILLGVGSNGKTSLIQLLARLIGQDRVSMTRIEELEANRFMTSNLLGKYMFCDDDVRAGARIPDGSLKKISEEKLVTAERKFGSTFSFMCRTVPVLACNNYLSLADISYGMLRRLMVIPFDRKFAQDEIDRTLFDRIWETEKAGVLNRAIRGLQRVRERRMAWKVPKAVKAATKKWVTQSNPLPAFVTECCQTETGFWCYQAELYAAYRNWAEAGGYSMIQQVSNFQKNLEHLGYRKGTRGSQGIKITGLRLRSAKPSSWA